MNQCYYAPAIVKRTNKRSTSFCTRCNAFAVRAHPVSRHHRHAGPRRLQEHQQQKTVESVSHQQSKQQHAWIVPERSNMTHLACGASTSRIATSLRRSGTCSWSRPTRSRDPRPPSWATRKSGVAAAPPTTRRRRYPSRQLRGCKRLRVPWNFSADLFCSEQQSTINIVGSNCVKG